MKIRQIFIGLCLAGAFTVLPSCDDVLDVEPEFSRDADQLFNNLEDYEFALTGAYSLFRQGGYYNTAANQPATYAQIPDMMTDNFAETGESLANYRTITDWIYASDNAIINQTWQNTYAVINQANVVLRGLEQFESTDAERVNRIRGQALAIRAFVHFDVLRYWGSDFERNSTGLGVPYKTTTDYEETPARLSVSETYDNIFRDLQQAEEMLGDIDRAINPAATRSRIDQIVVQAMLARINLYARDYGAAESYATQVIDAMPEQEDGTSLAPRDVFPSIWNDASQAEVIWTVPFNAGEGNPGSNTYFASGNRNSYRPTATLLATYDPNNDIRYPSYFRTVGTTSNPTRIVLSKFIGRGTVLDNLVNFKVFRVAEMYLIRAEARARSGNPLGGLADLNALRAARIQNYVPAVLAGQPLLDAIALERQKELIGEGHRWFDLKRTTRTITRQDCAAGRRCELQPTAREWVWPIPQNEIDNNPNINQENQAPGY
jgi:starch-binding outer membrane protein, SusD/RagB family